jgi:hypothetical protein
MSTDEDQPAHSHLTDFPEPLAALFTRMAELKLVLGPAGAAGVDRVEALLHEALAARERGDVPVAVARIAAAMETLAGLAGGVVPGDATVMRAMVEQFEQALRRGAVGEAKQAADVMRERSGSVLRPKKDR